MSLVILNHFQHRAALAQISKCLLLKKTKKATLHYPPRGCREDEKTSVIRFIIQTRSTRQVKGSCQCQHTKTFQKLSKVQCSRMSRTKKNQLTKKSRTTPTTEATKKMKPAEMMMVGEMTTEMMMVGEMTMEMMMVGEMTTMAGPLVL